MSESHEKLPKLFWIQLALAAIIGIIFLTTPSKHNEESSSSSEAKVETASKNLKPVGNVATKTSAEVTSAKSRSGEEVYKASCLACHAAGIADAPKPDDKAAWEPRVATGLDAMIKTAIEGKGAMPARGGNPAVTDEEIKAAILYMTDMAGFDLSSSTNTDSATNAVAETKPTEDAIPAVAAVIPVAPAAPAAPVAPKVTEEVVEAPSADNKKGEEVYKSSCFACHESGVAESPKLGDKEAWVARIATGNDALYTAAISGKGVMPPKGGNMGLSDDDVKAAVDFMVTKSQ